MLFLQSISYRTAGIAQSVLRLVTDWTAEGWEFEPRYGQDCSPLHVVQTGSGSHSASYPVGTGGSFPGVKLAIHLQLAPRSRIYVDVYLHSSICLHGVVLNYLCTGATLSYLYIFSPQSILLMLVPFLKTIPMFRRLSQISLSLMFLF
jgi:hypothetical protein